MNFHSVEIIHGYSHSDLSNILRGVNLGIIPVLWEDNLPQVAIEMVALGVPVLSSDAGGASELCSSNLFKFKSGNKKDFLQKLTYFVKNPEQIKSYWEYHTGLVTNKMHCEEIEKIFELPEKPVITLTLDDYSNLIAENEFLYKHFQGEVRIDEEGIRHRDWQIGEIQRERDEIREQRDHLQYVIDETRNSVTYKTGRALTWLPRKIRGDK